MLVYFGVNVCVENLDGFRDSLVQARRKMTWVELPELHVFGCSSLPIIPPTDSKLQRNCDLEIKSMKIFEFLEIFPFSVWNRRLPSNCFCFRMF